MEDKNLENILGGQQVKSSLKHCQLRDIIADSLKRGDFKPGDMLPAQTKLAEHYGVSHNTVREAVTLLVQEGLLHRMQGKGTFVVDRKPDPVTIGLVVPRLFYEGMDEHNPGIDVTPRLVRSIEKEIKKHGAHLLLCLDNDDIEMERQNLLSLLEYKVDAAIIYYWGAERNLDCIRKLRDAGVHIVLIDTYIDDMNLDYVVTDNVCGAYQAVKKLLDAGVKKIYHVTTTWNISTATERKQGYINAMQEQDLEPIVLHCMDFLMDKTDAEMLTLTFQRILNENVGEPIGVFTTNAATAAMVWDCISDYIVDPQNFYLACFDEPYIAFPNGMHVVKVLQQLNEIGAKSVEIVMSKLDGNTDVQQVRFKPLID
ncbi:GntR family transcriptional regulator [uncultured Desulfobulbus sp.]|uniref:GntR family transcriptional regulator n=1 Tax=uncultured Desulfobulbus sp. TaxID=239745 RepID=UPI0029C80E44|nr:GntR family transcriptional regulator [uncultured Desulfobulbus sp.]